MTRIKTPKDEKTAETAETTMDGTDTSVKSEPADTGTPSYTIDETPVEELPAMVGADEVDSQTAGSAEQSTSSTEQIETTVEDCEVLYGVIMETAHGMAKKKGKGHRGLPETRRKAQGRLLHSICEKYGITIPTEFELVIFGGALIADWQYMTVDKDESEREIAPVEVEDES